MPSITEIAHNIKAKKVVKCHAMNLQQNKNLSLFTLDFVKLRGRPTICSN
jgi:hypothetical protein